jgi:hypothetical protein
MDYKIRKVAVSALVATLTMLAACVEKKADDKSGASDEPSTPSHSVGGTVLGLRGTGLVLQNNGGDDLAVDAGSDSFTFSTPVIEGANYSVRVKKQPSAPAQKCAVSNGRGEMGGSDVVSVTVACISEVKVNFPARRISYYYTGDVSDYVEAEYDANTREMLLTSYWRAGLDESWFTGDDVVSRYYYYQYDVNGNVTSFVPRCRWSLVYGG